MQRDRKMEIKLGIIWDVDLVMSHTSMREQELGITAEAVREAWRSK